MTRPGRQRPLVLLAGWSRWRAVFAGLRGKLQVEEVPLAAFAVVEQCDGMRYLEGLALVPGVSFALRLRGTPEFMRYLAPGEKLRAPERKRFLRIGAKVRAAAAQRAAAGDARERQAPREVRA